MREDAAAENTPDKTSIAKRMRIIEHAIGLRSMPRMPTRIPLWKNRYLYVCVLLIATIAILPVTVNSPVLLESVFSLYLYAIALLTAVWAARGSIGHMFIVGVLVISALFMEHLHELDVINRKSVWFIFTVGLWICATVRSLFIIGRDLSDTPSIRLNEILGAMAVYLLLGILWTTFYVTEVVFDPHAFYLDPERYSNTVASAGDLLFFSFATLTTLGYGDVTPMSALARSLAVVEAVVGVLFLATLIARFVSVGNMHELTSELVDTGEEEKPKD